MPAGAVAAVLTRVTVPTPTRWDVDRPYLYTAVSTVRRGDAVLDRYATPFGIRTIEWGPGKGFLLNGRRVPLKGVCNHHDLGALGAAVSRRATERQLEILRKMGANAIRTSHNPPSPELLEAADRMGFLVMDEAFDMWGMAKVKNGHGKYFEEWSERDLRDMIRRDRNHPSVVMWSIGNEILEQAKEDGWKEAKRLTDICHEEDPTRPVTAGFNQVENAIKNGLADQVDIPGFNYGVRDYAKILAEHPTWTIVGAETASCVSSRGVYHLPIEKYEKHPSLQLTSYDVISPPWAYCPDVEFAGLDESPAVLGEFVWTGFDYLGEPTPYFAWDKPRDEKDWPARSSYFGIVDLAGFPKDRFYLYQSQWTDGTKEPMVHVLPHWNWAGREGQPIPVMAYTNAEEVELLLNGQSLGRKKKGEPFVMPVGQKISDDLRFTTKYRLVWEVPYAPGTLKAVAYTAGKPVASAEVKTAGAPARVVLGAGPGDDPRRRRGPVVRDRAGRGRGRQPRAGRRQPREVRRGGRRAHRRRRQRQRREPGAVPGRPAPGVQRPRPPDRPLEAGREGTDPGDRDVGRPGRCRSRPESGVGERHPEGLPSARPRGTPHRGGSFETRADGGSGAVLRVES